MIRPKLVFRPNTWANGIGQLANAHLARISRRQLGPVAGCTSSPFLEFPCDPAEWIIARRDFMLREPVDGDADGWMVSSDGAGLGLELDEDRLAATRIGWQL